MPLKLISVNIEYDKHFDTVLPFLQREQPDVVCVQEVFFADLPLLQQTLGMNFLFFPCVNMNVQTKYRMPPRGIGGVAIFTKIPFITTALVPYAGNSAKLDSWGQPNDGVRAVIVVTVEKDSASYTVATTHFTWTPDGEASELQRTDARKLKQILSNFPELILTGDMNSPRGGELFTTLGEGMIDVIPPEVTTTIDPDLHYSGGLELVVDALFLSDVYHAKSVQVVSGVSDHKAIVAEVTWKDTTTF